MPWLLVLHIVFLLIWCGALFYLPALIASSTGNNFEVSSREHVLLTRQLFNLLATPAALFTIASGTLLFLLQGMFGAWLILKLTAVAVMVICHALYGALILRLEREPQSAVTSACIALAVASALAALCVVWLVLAKPV
ncbi:CopD family protein [Azotobacter armeniacus]